MLNKQEKEKLTALEKAKWKDESMVKYCVNKAAFLYDLRGKTVIVEKHGIETHFCFGYSLSRYDSEDYDRANEMADYASKNEWYFITKNHERAGYASTIEALNDGRWKAYARPEYCGNCPDLYSICFCRWDERIPEDGFELTDTEKRGYKLILAKAAQEHHKKIKAYLKRYGLSKVESWSYWQDA